MNDNIFIDKFEKKTNSELEYILVNRDNYTDDAISACIHILKNRNIVSELLELVEKEFKLQLENNAATLQAIEIKENKTTPHSNTPELYSKRLIFAFSILFSTIFGAVLLMQNMKQVENKTGRNQVLIFGVVFIFINALVFSSIAMERNLGLFLNIAGGWILTEYFWNKYIGKEKQFIKRSWVKPTVISILITIPLVIFMMYEYPNMFK